MMRIGVDLGGTKIEGIALDELGRPLLRRRVATPKGVSARAIAHAVAELVHGIERDLGASGRVGIGTPGAISPASGLMKNSNTTCLNGQPVQQLLEEAIGREVRVANDANCFALSEAIDGAGAGAGVVFGVILGTGTGGGVVVDRRVLVGPNAIAGEWGHNPLPWPNADDTTAPCYCGKSGCLETFLSGPGMASDHTQRTGEVLAAPDLAPRAAEGFEAELQTLSRYVSRLARGLASVINILDPDVIVLGGGLSNIETLYAALPHAIEAWVFSDTLTTAIVPAQHGDSSGVRGAAWLWSPDE